VYVSYVAALTLAQATIKVVTLHAPDFDYDLSTLRSVVTPETKLTNTRDFTSAAGQQLLAHAKALGANPSNADAARIEKIVGSIDTDPQALQNIMEWTEQQARRSIQLHNARVKQVEDSPPIHLLCLSTHLLTSFHGGPSNAT
jgi:hypothetical protein